MTTKDKYRMVRMHDSTVKRLLALQAYGESMEGLVKKTLDWYEWTLAKGMQKEKNVS